MARRKVVPEGKQRVVIERGIYRKANGKIQATARDPGGRQHWKEFTSVKEARLWRSKASVDPASLMMGKRKLREVWDDFNRHQGPNLKASTRENWNQEWVAHIGPALGGWPVGKITVGAMKDFLSDLEHRGVGSETRKKCRTILRRLFAECVENGELPSNPASAPGTRVRGGQRKPPRVLTPTEVASAIEAARQIGSPSDALAVETLCTLGLRPGEMAGLQARDIDWKNREMVIRRTVVDVRGKLLVQDSTKTSRYRVIPLPEGLGYTERLRLFMIDEGLIGEAHLFRSALGGPLRINNWRRRIWNRAMAVAAPVDSPTPHHGRHTAASLLASIGTPPLTIAAILGHSTLRQTADYIQVSKEQMGGALEGLGDLLNVDAIG